MTNLFLKLEAIIPRLDSISRDLSKLRTLAELPEEEFCDQTKDHFDLAKLRLREALEGVFHIGAHILSRLPGGRPTEYKEIARKLGEFGIVDQKFASEILARMAGYRNRLTHFYAEISPPELHSIITTQLPDFEIYLAAIKKVLAEPEKYNLHLEN